MNRRVVITGIGILSSIGIGREEFWNALRQGKSGIRPISLFDSSEFNVRASCEVPDFQPQKYMGHKGLRSLDRSTTLLVSASRLCLRDGSVEVTLQNSDIFGVAVGSTLGSLKSISEFDDVTLNEGPRYTNPAHFPNTVINSPSSQVSIWNSIQGFNTTISTGFTASLDAIRYACDFIVMDRVEMALAGGVEELCPQTYYGFHELGLLSGSKMGEPFVNCPFDRRRNGMTLGEGTCLVLLEEYEHALKRQATIWGEILGFGAAFDSFRLNKYNPQGTGMRLAMRRALEDASLEPDDIGYICAHANSMQNVDKFETEAIKDVFGKDCYRVPVSSIKSMTGECYSTSAAFSLAAGLGAINRHFVPPTINYEFKDTECDLDYVPNQSREMLIDNVLINAFGPNGNTCLVIGQVRD